MKLADAEAAVQAAEDAVRRLEEELCKPEIFGDAAKAAETAKALDEAKKALDDAYWNWMELQ